MKTSPSKRSNRSNLSNVQIDPELLAKFETLAKLKGQSLSEAINIGLADYMEVTGEGEIEHITGIKNPTLPQLPTHIEQESAPNVIMMLSQPKARISSRNVS